MSETATAIPAPSLLADRSPAARRGSPGERAGEPARSPRAPRPAEPPPSPERRPVTQARVSILLLRIQGEYLEMPGLKLTEAQACRLWALDSCTCRLVLTRLVETRFLKRAANGTYVRATD